ncbi:pyruvate dehydrogenase E1 component alpha subunit [Tranquillimonas rosea]|uniref:Pyruvate dehydrogenase E1 component alpha subunit n=1 Tax=Tranquillimonas rosea TaxID=641238 RepID=A0A1H9TCR6_9RHOB|nr:thiamine pyrophosphate-dependent enzyme [Tranquillimonas rosea]SER94906.1 pyruvate dehydrogenase E1 component alpha subunit [Tranquillimonas rosea]
MSGDPAAVADTTEAALALYRTMALIRRFEEKAGQLYGLGLIGGFCHLSIGQEAVSAGLGAAARPGDTRLAGRRGHGHMLAAGIPPEALMAELLGRETGLCGGRAGSLHVVSPAHGYHSGHGLIGAQIPLAAGLALAHRSREDAGVTFAVFGDRAADQGRLDESLALAVRLALPVVYVLETNRESAEAAATRARVAARAELHGIPSREVDGMDARAVAAAAEKAAERARRGRGPSLIAARTYRYRGHAMGDTDRARSRDEQRRVRARHDPLDLLREALIGDGAAEAAQLRAIETEARDRVAAAAEAARAAPEAGAAVTAARTGAPV